MPTNFPSVRLHVISSIDFWQILQTLLVFDEVIRILHSSVAEPPHGSPASLLYC